MIICKGLRRLYNHTARLSPIYYNIVTKSRVQLNISSQLPLDNDGIEQSQDDNPNNRYFCTIQVYHILPMRVSIKPIFGFG